MAFASIDFFSYTLGMDTTMKVLLPEKRQQSPVRQPGRQYPVLYLLHGHSDDDSGWIRKSLIELLVRDLDLIVVMPNCHRSFYTNGKETHRYFDFIARELPVVVSNFFPASDKREDTCVAGISMGGYGAFKLALTYPERYRAAASISGALYPFDVVRASKTAGMFTTPDFEEQFYRIFGSEETFAESDDNLEQLIRRLSKSSRELPHLFQCAGTEDPLFQSSQTLLAVLEEAKLPVASITESGGHNWDFWNRMIPVMMKELGYL